ncbi:MAG: signal peptidase I [Dehalococcoidia bacterium]
MKRLEWPGLSEFDDEQEEIVDPQGHWLPDGNEPAQGRDPMTFEAVFRDERRWAPQHGLQGRSDSALPGPFLYPEPQAGEEPLPDFIAEPVVVAPVETTGRRSALVREFVETALLAILVFLAVRASIQHYRVEGDSMDPTLEDGEFLLVNSLVYSQVNIQKIADFVPFWDPGPPDVRQVFHGPERGDIVILNPRQRHDRDLVKRIVGMPGDRFEIRDGNVYINGQRLIEPYIKEPWRGDMDPIQIPAGQYFVMGDNRNGSLDSRSFGLVVEDDIIGKAMASWWPKEKWGLAPNEEPKLAPN